ncbi:protein of unknown function [Candidatus Methylopumilus planktonicus]|uniref:Uncharacterized protein n=1 Tax=Candidatus Methylopumilus planktonicus TaxID=1581557 RepID=A0A0D6EUQ5_9PROT|nr:hypothetical protein [Candidatus Methylopumilus planktonicus]CEZ19445.1 protein of unknown function [Candidatus Methylopumilus planktonicus]
MPSKTRQQVKASQKLKTLKAPEDSELKVLRTSDGDVFVCKQGDTVCWQRYTSAMTDCV